MGTSGCVPLEKSHTYQVGIEIYHFKERPRTYWFERTPALGSTCEPINIQIMMIGFEIYSMLTGMPSPLPASFLLQRVPSSGDEAFGRPVDEAQVLLCLRKQ